MQCLECSVRLVEQAAPGPQNLTAAPDRLPWLKLKGCSVLSGTLCLTPENRSIIL